MAEDDTPGTFEDDGKRHQRRAHRTFQNTVTAWWDASQIYGYDEISRTRVKRDPADRARLLLQPVGEPGGSDTEQGYLPRFAAQCGDSASDDCDRIQPQLGQPGGGGVSRQLDARDVVLPQRLSREHNLFVDVFRSQAAQTPEADSGLRNPAAPDREISYAEVTDDNLFEAARLVVSAEIAKIHAIEWTTQLLYDDPLYRAINSNWSGLFDGKSERVQRALDKVVQRIGS